MSTWAEQHPDFAWDEVWLLVGFWLYHYPHSPAPSHRHQTSKDVGGPAMCWPEILLDNLFTHFLGVCMFDSKVAIAFSPHSALQRQCSVYSCMTLCLIPAAAGYLLHLESHKAFFHWASVYCFKQIAQSFTVTSLLGPHCLLLLLCFQGSNASWSCVSSSSTCKRWSQWGIVPASRWSSLPQSESRDCFSCQTQQKQWWENPGP